jgi:murein DD-endopeptidase MepM/ murein hydrolase activator NlpD
MLKKSLFIIILVGLGYFGYSYWQRSQEASVRGAEEEIGQATTSAPVLIPKDRIVSHEISDGMTFAKLLTDKASTSYARAIEIYEAALPVYDLTKIKVGKQIELAYRPDEEEFYELRYKIDSEEEIAVSQEAGASSSPAWKTIRRPIPYELREKVVRGTVQSSMYQAALDNDIDIRAIIELANAFQWSIDFAMDPRVGDSFVFLFEERYLDGEYVMPGRILAGKYVNAGTELAVYQFEESAENKGFFDAEGNSAQKMFLKAPVEFRYISSGFTTGLRYVEAFNVSTGHRAIDYAAANGTPIRSVGDGVVTVAGWNGPFGNFVSIRHNGTYTTNYGHQSKIAVKKGQRVKQGEVIGYVGSTGFSTGPHLHYEMEKDGVKINPLTDVQPPGTPIKEENRARFEELKKKYDSQLAESAGQ